jgi:hypothetical protein
MMPTARLDGLHRPITSTPPSVASVLLQMQRAA